jgi:hypothetical protein
VPQTSTAEAALEGCAIGRNQLQELGDLLAVSAETEPHDARARQAPLAAGVDVQRLDVVVLVRQPFADPRTRLARSF